MDISTSSIQRLMEIGYMATGGGMNAEAAAIFSGIEAVRPESELPMIGSAVTRLNAGKVEEAISLLRQALEKNPDSDLAAAFLGLALKQAGLAQAAESMLRQVVDAARNREAVDLAKSLLDAG